MGSVRALEILNCGHSLWQEASGKRNGSELPFKWFQIIFFQSSGHEKSSSCGWTHIGGSGLWTLAELRL